MKKGFTLVEVLAIIVIMGIIAVVIAPVINNGIKTNSEKALEIQRKRIVDAAKDWSLEHFGSLPNNGGILNIKLSELKKGYISINVKNPDTGKILSDESYVKITNSNGDYTYEAFIYDIPEQITSDEVPKFNGDFTDKTISFNGSVEQYITSVTDADGNNLDYSIQYILNNNEVSNIDTSISGTYSIVYTVLYNEKIYKRVKTIIVN